jgi:protein-L-isoaspartate O-methyltransferase
MLAVSNVITLELGSVPLVWVLPLVLYLLSYVFTFSRRQWISPALLHAFWPAAVVCGLSSLYFVDVGNLWVFAAHLVALFVLAMVGHGELHRLRPPPDQLTVFYLAIALGGWMGSMAVSLIAPILFNSLAEYPIILGVFALTILHLRKGDLLDALRRRPLLSSLGVSLALALPFLIRSNDLGAGTEVIYQHRNYYGIYQVVSQPLSQDKFPNLSEEERYNLGQRQLVHGSTIHGSQVLHPISRRSPTSYYHRAGPLWDVLGAAKKARNVAVIGLGVGTCATYFQEGESLTFYELDPAIVNIAQNLFTYLVDCPAKVKMVVGDARLQLEQAPEHSYDIILVDAFSSDAIPTHLLTREALSLYEEKLAPQGTLVFHTSSRYYDLLGVIKSTSAERWEALVKKSNENLKQFQDEAVYCVLRRKGDDVSALRAAGWLSMEGYPIECAPWSDDYINTLLPLYLMLRPH